MSDNEILVGNNRLYINEDGIMRITIIGATDEAMAGAIIDAALKLEEKIPGKIEVLLDLSKAGTSSPDAITLWKDLIAKGKADKLAMVGLGFLAKSFTCVLLSGSTNLRCFDDEAEALAWFKE